MSHLINMVEFLRPLKEARAGEALTTNHFKAQREIFSRVVSDTSFVINPMKIALESGLDSVTISTVVRWWSQGGFLERSSELSEVNTYRATEKCLILCNMHPLHIPKL